MEQPQRDKTREISPLCYAKVERDYFSIAVRYTAVKYRLFSVI